MSVQTLAFSHTALESHCSELAKLKDEIAYLKDENFHQRAQILNLAQVNIFAQNIVGLTNSTPNEKIRELAKNKIIHFLEVSRNIIMFVPKNLAVTMKKIKDLVIDMCNFVYDHLGDIAIGTIIGLGVTVCVAASALLIGAATGNLSLTASIVDPDEMNRVLSYV